MGGFRIRKVETVRNRQILVDRAQERCKHAKAGINQFPVPAVQQLCRERRSRDRQVPRVQSGSNHNPPTPFLVSGWQPPSDDQKPTEQHQHNRTPNGQGSPRHAGVGAGNLIIAYYFYINLIQFQLSFHWTKLADHTEAGGWPPGFL